MDDPYPTNWLAQCIREIQSLGKTPVVAALVGALCGGGFAGCQGMKNADRIDDTKNVVVGQAAEVKGELATATEKQNRKLGAIEETVKKGK